MEWPAALRSRLRPPGDARSWWEPERVASWLLRPDIDRVARRLARRQARRPGAARGALAEEIAGGAAVLAAAACVGCGLPGGLLAIPAALAEELALLRVEIRAAAELALLHDPSFFEGDGDPLERLAPLLGFDHAREIAGRVQRAASWKISGAVALRVRAALHRPLGRWLGASALRRAWPIASGLASAAREGAEQYRRARRVHAVLESRAPAQGPLPALPAPTQARPAAARGSPLRERLVEVIAAGYRVRYAIGAVAAGRRAGVSRFIAEARGLARRPRAGAREAPRAA
jgi:hypothetical protein